MTLLTKTTIYVVSKFTKFMHINPKYRLIWVNRTLPIAAATRRGDWIEASTAAGHDTGRADLVRRDSLKLRQATRLLGRPA